MPALQETIRPSADLRNHYNEVSKQCREQNEAVIFTVNGRGDTVSISYEEYKKMKARLELLEMLAESEEDVRNGRVAPMQDSFDDIRKRLTEMQTQFSTSTFRSKKWIALKKFAQKNVFIIKSSLKKMLITISADDII